MYPKVDGSYSTPAPAASVATGIPFGMSDQSFPTIVPSDLHSQPLVKWSTGLCNCCDDPGNCCMTCICPCVTFGRVAEIVDRGSTSCGTSGALYTLIMCVTGCTCLYSCFYRAKMRGQYSLHETPCNDCLVHCCCECCALCQEYRELKRRGFDLTLGWNANVERQGGVQSTAAPAVQGGMSR